MSCTPVKQKNVNSFIKNAIDNNPDVPEPIINHLINYYGSQYLKVLEITKKYPDLLNGIGTNNRNLPHLLAEIHYAVKEESALTLEDFVMRRSEIGNLGHPGAEYLQTIVSEMCKLLNWDDEKKAKEINDLNQCFPMLALK